MAIKNVALLGANGGLGPAMLEALLSAQFDLVVLKREGSKSSDEYPSSVTIARIPDDLNLDSLVKVLRGVDALVVTIKGSQTVSTLTPRIPPKTAGVDNNRGVRWLTAEGWLGYLHRVANVRECSVARLADLDFGEPYHFQISKLSSRPMLT